MEFIQKTSYFKQLKNGKRTLKIRGAILKISISNENIVGVQQIMNERTKRPYKNFCIINLVNFNQYDNQLVVYHKYDDLKTMFAQENKTIKGFGK